MISVIGGVYREHCMSPNWEEIYGSGGRAATALARMGAQVELHAYVDETVAAVIGQRALIEGFRLSPVSTPESAAFSYTHGLSAPRVHRPFADLPAIELKAQKIVRFGMVEGDAKIEADYAVYDPQNAITPQLYSANGSSAKHLAIILNRSEAQALLPNCRGTTEQLALELANAEAAEIVIIKQGPLGALVYYEGQFSSVPAYSTSRVHKIGSGDNFVAHFAHAWLEAGLSPHDAADMASRATAYYCEHRGFPSRRRLKEYQPAPLMVSEDYRHGKRPKVYLAGPFFTLAQLWLVEEARNILLSMGLQVFSPYHDVGHGTAAEVVQKDIDAIHECELMFAIGDGLDAGTLYEIGYARALNKKVIMYAENESEEDKKMMEGSHCILCNDFVTAIYSTVWQAIAL